MFTDGMDSLDALFNTTHTFQLEQRFRKCLGIKGTKPSQQHQLIEDDPVAVCQNCKATEPVYICHGPDASKDQQNGGILRRPEWDEKRYAVLRDVEAWEKNCGDIVKFSILGMEREIERAVLQHRQPQSVLAECFLEVWKDDPYATVSLKDDAKYLALVLKFVCDGCVKLPSQIDRDDFMSELQKYKINFSPCDIVGSTS